MEQELKKKKLSRDRKNAIIARYERQQEYQKKYREEHKEELKKYRQQYRLKKDSDKK